MFLDIEKFVIDKSCGTKYELIGVIIHLGPSDCRGHFKSFCKSPVDNNWYLYNDRIVRRCGDPGSEINEINQRFLDNSAYPYILLYQKIKEIPNSLIKSVQPNEKMIEVTFTSSDQRVKEKIVGKKYRKFYKT